MGSAPMPASTPSKKLVVSVAMSPGSDGIRLHGDVALSAAPAFRRCLVGADERGALWVGVA